VQDNSVILSAAVTALGFVGLGHMGGNMAARLLGAGYTVYGETRHHGAVQDLEREGLIWRDTPREIAEATDFVFTSVPNDSALEEVASGPDGILAGLAAEKVWVDVSTVSPHVSRDLAQRVRERGAAMLDAPVSGSVPQVQTGTLTIMVGGDEHAYARAEPILRELGTPPTLARTGRGWC
jgi:3-hydroxyisobutyrate dehydrogenase-like beta-hydroxyacid dehydrogenase